MNLKKLGDFFFKQRSYTPLPFVIVMLIFMDPKLINIITGLSVSLIGELIRIWAVSYAGSETRTTSAVGGSYLVTQGPYAMVRNPLYIGNILIYTGFGIMSNALFPWLPVAGLIYFTFQYYCIILNEEGYLRKTFGDTFEQYSIVVKRFLPEKNIIPPEISSDLSFNLNAGLRSERRSIQAFVITTIILLASYFTGFSPYKLFGRML